MLNNNLLSSLKFSEHAGVAVIASVRPMHDKSPTTPYSELESFECINEVLWPPPLRQPAWIGKCGIDFIRGIRNGSLRLDYLVLRC